MEKYKILYEDRDVFVICKAPGFPVQSARASVPDVMSLLMQELIQRGEKYPYLGLVNRLDQPVEGIFLIGRNKQTAAQLSRELNEHTHMEKYYQALVCGTLSPEEGTMVDYLIKDGRTNTSRVVPPGTKGGKRSELCYRMLKRWENRSLLEIRLLTGRHHQIRVQLAHAGVPIVGDAKYGKADPGKLCLCSYKTTFRHPRTKEFMTFEIEPSFSLPQK